MIRQPTRSLAWSLASLALSLNASAQAPPMAFIQHREGRLYDGGDEFRFVSWNIPNLHNIEDAFEFLGASPWRWPNEFEIRDALETVRQMGGRVARTYVISVRREGGDMGSNVHVIGPGQFNEQAFRTLDLVLKVAREKDVRLIIPLVDNWKWWGGVRQYEAFRRKPDGAFWTDEQLIEDFEATIRFVLERRNSLTGVRYRDDPTILGWETGNELDSPPSWTRRIAATMKRLDANHLVIDGRSLRSLPTESLDDPNIDVLTTHHYPNSGNNNAASVEEAIDTIDGRKAYFVGEFGFLPVVEAERILDTVITKGASGALYWSLRFHRREGGFYWHHEPSGDDRFKSYHWPGFKEGESYRENLVLPMIRRAAFRIRGLQEPAPTAPKPPRLLSPTEPHRLSWQGSAGASGYDIQRSNHPSGDWETIATNASDAEVQYRPLFCDETAQPGVGYRYRVIARNTSGVSPPSNVVTTQAAAYRLLVDEMQGAARIEKLDGRHGWKTGDARTVQEDIHRLALEPGASVTYQADGIRRVRAWLFGKNGRASVVVEASTDGKGYTASQSRRQIGPEQANDYGYLRPILLTAEWPSSRHDYVRLSVPKDAAHAVEVSRIEIEYAQP